MNSFLNFKRQRNQLPLYTRGFVHEADFPVIIDALKFFAGDKCDNVLVDWHQSRNANSFTKLWLEDLSSQRRVDDDSSKLQPGESLLNGQYRVIAQIGIGGQAVAYKAEMITDEGMQQVALKEFFLPVRGGREMKKRALTNVEHEAALLKMLEHPQIVRFIDVFGGGARAYLVTELVNGQSLRRLVQANGPFSEVRCASIANQLCDILMYLHGLSPPIIHRDFTPDNLLLRPDDTVVLIDFNVAERLESECTHTVVGKQSYISPEQFRGQASVQTDIYSLGCVLHWLLTGEDPEPINVSHPRDVNPLVSAGLDNLVATATAIDVAKRYVDAAEVKNALLCSPVAKYALQHE